MTRVVAVAEAVAAGTLPGRVWMYSNYHCNLACSYCLTASAPGVPRRELGPERAVVGLAQSVTITLSVLNTPGEWEWSCYLMMAAHLGVFALAAGRTGGLDGLLRPIWAQSGSRPARLLLRTS